MSTGTGSPTRAVLLLRRDRRYDYTVGCRVHRRPQGIASPNRFLAETSKGVAPPICLRGALIGREYSAMSKLTEKEVLKNARVDSLEQVRTLNCWARKLKDVSILSQLPNLEVLNLSCNDVGTLENIANCVKLTELYIRRNQLGDFKELQYLASLSKLEVLWLYDNPISSDPNYRSKVIRMLPQVKKLDNQIVSEEERACCHLASTSRPKSNILQAVELLLQELSREELEDVHAHVQQLMKK
ncbi:hypothetical protein EMCRGX_G011106 [Ephydatia muelleri]